MLFTSGGLVSLAPSCGRFIICCWSCDLDGAAGCWLLAISEQKTLQLWFKCKQWEAVGRIILKKFKRRT